MLVDRFQRRFWFRSPCKPQILPFVLYQPWRKEVENLVLRNTPATRTANDSLTVPLPKIPTRGLKLGEPYTVGAVFQPR